MPESNPIPTHYQRQHDHTKNQNPIFVFGVAVYMNEVRETPTGPQGSIAIEFGAMDRFGEKRALNQNPSNIEMAAAAHQLLTSLQADPEVRDYFSKLAKAYKQQEIDKQFEQISGGLTPLQRAKINAVRSKAENDRVANDLMKRLG